MDMADYQEEQSQGKEFTKLPHDMAVLMVGGNNVHWSSVYRNLQSKYQTVGQYYGR